ncbi:hypothetical protein M1V48_24875, partial [Escherichia coli]|nr:hypothetical protein [Escherichia coli]MCO4951363.1 hypothetical protein [Escherichia coli]
MKKFFRHFLFLILCLSCYTASAGTDDNVGYIVGNSYGVGPSDQKWRETGPNGDATVIFRYATSTNNLVFYKPTQLGPTGVKLQWSQLDTASGGGFLYCNRSDSTSGSAMLMNPLMILVKIIKLRWIHILSYDQMVSRKINNQTTRC